MEFILLFLFLAWAYGGDREYQRGFDDGYADAMDDLEAEN